MGIQSQHDLEREQDRLAERFDRIPGYYEASPMTDSTDAPPVSDRVFQGSEFRHLDDFDRTAEEVTMMPAMQLEATLADITGKLKEGRFANEQSISQGIVLRVLSDLNWSVYDTNVVWPEYSTGEGRVDFALCEPSAKPRVFIEVKQPDGAEGGVRQAMEYAFHTGVTFLVLTDGKTWSFYLPAEEGSYEERRVFMLNLFERSIAESAKILQHYLERSRIASGEAFEVARKEYRNQNRRMGARKAIPDAWVDIVDSGDESLLELLADAVESKVGIRPDDEDVVDFLVSLRRQVSVGPLSSNSLGIGIKPPEPPSMDESGVSPRTKPSRRGTLIISGKEFSYNNAKEGVAIVLRELQKTDPTFLQRFYQHPKNKGRKRRYVSQSIEELYPDRPDWRKACEHLPDNWLLATNMNNQLKKIIVQTAAEVAGLKLGKDIIVDFDS